MTIEDVEKVLGEIHKWVGADDVIYDKHRDVADRKVIYRPSVYTPGASLDVYAVWPLVELLQAEWDNPRGPMFVVERA